MKIMFVFIFIFPDQPVWVQMTYEGVYNILCCSVSIYRYITIKQSDSRGSKHGNPIIIRSSYVCNDNTNILYYIFILVIYLLRVVYPSPATIVEPLKYNTAQQFVFRCYNISFARMVIVFLSIPSVLTTPIL